MKQKYSTILLAVLMSMVGAKALAAEDQTEVEDAYFNFAEYSSYPFYNVALGEHTFEDGCLVVLPQEPTEGNWERQYFVADWISLEAGREYTVTVRMKGSSEGYADVVLGTWDYSNTGKIEFTNEWQELATTIMATGDAGATAHVLLQTGHYAGEIRIEWVKVSHKEVAGPPTHFVSLIDNGDMEGTDAKNFAKKENSGNVVYEITDGVGVGGSRGVKIESKGGQASAWESQFWIVSNEVLYEGDKVHVSFDYRADGGCVGTTVDTQAHFNPGDYSHYQMVGSPTFTADWQTYDKVVTISASMAGANGLKSIAFNMSPNTEDGAYYIVNIVFEVEEEQGSEPIEINEVNFPDENFRKILLAQDYGLDGKLTKREIKRITTIYANSFNISSLQGIEYFTALRTLHCGYNQLTSLDLSKNTELGVLYCYGNQLTSLDFSKNTELGLLYCSDNQLTSLDVSNNTRLIELSCGYNQLTSLDVSNNTTLMYLSCEGNQLTNLDVSNTLLRDLNCSNNHIKGESMDALISSLPQNETDEIYRLEVYNSGNDDNVCTKAQVAAAKAKGWTPYYHNGTEWVEYAGYDEESDGIGTIYTGKQGKNQIYTLDGKRLQTTNTADLPKGIYIINGKKVTVK